MKQSSNTRLTAHFTLGEFTRSSKATAIGLDNTPPGHYLPNLLALAYELEKYEPF